MTGKFARTREELEKLQPTGFIPKIKQVNSSKRYYSSGFSAKPIKRYSKMITTIISAFPGTGKSHLFRNPNGKIILDSDSSLFSWSEPGVRNPEFPENYIKHIKSNIGKADLILVSSHTEVRNALIREGVDFIAVYPDRSLKEEYLERYKQRGSDEAFVTLMDKNWDNFLDGLSSYNRCKVLKAGEFLSNHF